MNDPIGRTSGISDDLDVESIPAGSTLGGGSTNGTTGSDSVRREFGEARERLGDGVDEIRAAAADAATSIRDTTRDVAGDVGEILREMIRERPLAAVAAVAAGAYLLAKLTR
jgi:ElaB/YqjD/DUF883 family membrane-anchored ribosome-binding protein